MDNDKFEHVARAYGDTLYRVAYHAVGNRPDAEDVVQTTLLRLYERPEAFESEEHLKHWLLRVAVNESRKLLRTFWRRRVAALDEEWDAPAPEDSRGRELLEAVMALEGKYRVAVYLYYYEGCSVKETAAVMGARESTVMMPLEDDVMCSYNSSDVANVEYSANLGNVLENFGAFTFNDDETRTDATYLPPEE